MKFIIDRSKWRSGDNGKHAIGKGETRMLNSEGFMCCLGQISEQLGIPKKFLENAGEPDCLTHYAKQIKLKKIDILLKYNDPKSNDYDDDANCDYEQTYLTEESIGINDDPTYTTKKRENKLIELYNSCNHELEFIGESVKR